MDLIRGVRAEGVGGLDLYVLGFPVLPFHRSVDKDSVSLLYRLASGVLDGQLLRSI